MSSVILPPLSALYGAVTRARLSLYERGTFRTSKLARPVISIGNITTGGTGKTPLVEWIARAVAGQGKKVCILTRGYGRERPDRRVVVSDGESVLSNALEAGDEPFLLAKNLQGIAAVICDANRIAAGRDAIKHLQTECFVLDDGFQHLRLVRDLNIATVDATNPWGGGKLLPYGRLRENVSGLRRADCVVVTRADQTSEVDSVVEEIKTIAGDRPVFKSRMELRRVQSLDGSSIRPAGPYSVFCGIGNPTAFFLQLRQHGFDVIRETTFPDHHSYTQAGVDNLSKAAQLVGANSLLTTAKDAVKLTDFNFPLPCFVIEVEISIENDSELRRMISGVL
jgi:tetraacyldisaccharide 4'-kinase